MQEDYERQLQEMEESREKALEELTEYYDTRLQEMTAKLEQVTLIVYNFIDSLPFISLAKGCYASLYSGSPY